jgi:hypothetical protein
MSIVSMLLFNACQKSNEAQASLHPLSKLKASGWKIDGVKFNQNNIGIQHNILLDKVSQLSSFPNHNVDEVLELVMQDNPQKYKILNTIRIVSQNEDGTDGTISFNEKVKKEMHSFDKDMVIKILSKNTTNRKATLTKKDEYIR